MRQHLLLSFAALLTLASACKKEDDDGLSIPYVPPYRVDGVVDFSLQKRLTGTATYTMFVGVEYENGEQERVSLSLENVPPGLHDSIRTSSGYPTFASNISFADSGVAEGSYTLKLVAVGQNSGRREYPFTVRVLPVPDCAALVVGGYTGTSNCVGGSGGYSVPVQAVPSVINRVTFSNLNNNGLQLFASVDCSNSGGGGSIYLSIPSQTVNGISYSGYGYYGMSGGAPGISLTVSQSGAGTCYYELDR